MMKLSFIIFLLAVGAMLGGCSVVSLRVVEDGNGSPISDAKVAFATGAGKETSLGKTDSMGSILIAPVGQGTIVITKPGFKAFRQDFATLSAGASIDSSVDIRLIREGREPSGFGKEGFLIDDDHDK